MPPLTEIADGYDVPQAYGPANSYYGDGRYPPDWNHRREAIWRQQSNACGRCGRHRETLAHAAVHHLQPLSAGGTNALANLVGLCGDCHALMHPLNDDLDGTPFAAPVFPAEDAVPSVATVRTVTTTDDIAPAITTDLETLEEFSTPETNVRALSTHTYDIEAGYARQLPEELPALLREHGVIAESGDYSRVEVTVTLRGLRGLLTSYTPDLTVDSDGTLVETSAWTGRWRTLTRHVTLSADTETATLVLQDGTGTTKQSLTLDGEPTTVTMQARPPSLWR